MTNPSKVLPPSILSSPERSAAGDVRADAANAARLVMVITFLLIFIMAARTPLDTDLWWHLRAGEEMLRTGHFLNADIFTFTRAGAHWVNPTWLPDILTALLFRGGGFLALGVEMALLATACMGLVFAQLEGPVFLRAAALLLASVVASVVWTPRPQLISLVYIALVGYLLFLYKRRGINRVWLLPLIFVLWGNTHGGYPLGLILIGTMLAGETLNHLLGIETSRVLSWRQIVQLGVWGIICGFSVLVSPNGLDMWRLPFLTVDIRALQQFIPEWASPDFHSLIEQSLLWLLLATFAAVGLSGRRMDGSDLVALLVFSFMALLARRNYGPFALVAAPLLVRYAAAAAQSSAGTWKAWREKRLPKLTRESKPESAREQTLKKVINLALVALLALVAIGKLYVVTQPALVGKYLSEGYPARAAAWLAGHREGGRVFNEYNWGGYMQWALPGFPIFVDGRTDLFGDEVIGEWMSAVQGNARWPETFARYQVDLVMLQPERPLIPQLQAAGWKLLYQDSQAVIYGH